MWQVLNKHEWKKALLCEVSANVFQYLHSKEALKSLSQPRAKCLCFVNSQHDQCIHLDSAYPNIQCVYGIRAHVVTVCANGAHNISGVLQQPPVQ